MTPLGWSNFQLQNIFLAHSFHNGEFLLFTLFNSICFAKWLLSKEMKSSSRVQTLDVAVYVLLGVNALAKEIDFSFPQQWENSGAVGVF